MADLDNNLSSFRNDAISGVSYLLASHQSRPIGLPSRGHPWL